MIELTPGEKVGSTIIHVTIPEQQTWRTGVGADNLGQRSSGQYQHSLSLEKDNFMGLGDQFAFYWTEHAPYLEKIRSGKKDKRTSQSFAAYTSLPLGYWTFSANMSFFHTVAPFTA